MTFELVTKNGAAWKGYPHRFPVVCVSKGHGSSYPWKFEGTIKVEHDEDILPKGIVVRLREQAIGFHPGPMDDVPKKGDTITTKWSCYVDNYYEDSFPEDPSKIYNVEDTK